MAEQKRPWSMAIIVLIGVAIVCVAVVAFNPKSDELPNKIRSPKKMALTTEISPGAVKAMSLDLVTGMSVPDEPTTNPAAPYAPMPLRVGTVGATKFHRPFCPYAKQSLATHGLEKRINYWTREQIAESGRPGDEYCLAQIFDCSDVTPADFAVAGNDPWCGANIRLEYMPQGISPQLAGKTLCSLQGYKGVFVDDPNHCINGQIRGSSPSCDQEACSGCTVDCETLCRGCVRVTLAYLNQVTLSMGDANKDGNADLEDYLYYHECYSGPQAASLPCQNVFDYDKDGNVDVDDFDMFIQSYNSGNRSWALANHPNAVIETSRPELPLRVGTEGSNYYHRLDCPSVNASWERHGMDRRVEYYNWDQVEQSGRVPDLNICLPGTRSNPSGSLQNCTLDDDGDGTLNCDDECPEDGNKTAPEACGCGIPDDDLDTDGIPDCNDIWPIREFFDEYEVGDQPLNWYDTESGNDLTNNDSLFLVGEVDGRRCMTTTSEMTNIHSHYIGDANRQAVIYPPFEFTGRMKLTDIGAGIGVTFVSDFPDTTSYYRLRRFNGPTGYNFHISPLGTALEGTIDTEVLPEANVWYLFKIEVRAPAIQTEIKAKIWAEGSEEPVDWQADCYDDLAPSRLYSGKIGLWSMGPGPKYWDDLVVTTLDD